MRATDRVPRTLVIVGFVFTLLSAATIAWRWSQGGAAGADASGTLTGGLLVLGVGLAMLYVRRGRSEEGT